ncbi:MAG: hypothetical protein HOM88_05090 [Hellea sp.]|jgi:hypothetical protein|nr:hypothetical protein [Hellea sp.]
MAASFYIKQNDTAPSIEAVLTDATGRARSMTNASAIKFHMTSEGGTSIVTDGLGAVVNASKGIVKYDWQPGDTANTGIHSAEFQIDYTNGTSETFPNTGYIKIIVRSELA